MEASPEANALGIRNFSAVNLKVLERRLEILQWQLFRELEAGSAKVIVDVAAKNAKQMLCARLPLTPDGPHSVCLPYGGTVSMNNPPKAQLFTSLFGVKFHVQPRPDALSSDILVAAWASKHVSKASDCFFSSHVRARKFLVNIDPESSSAAAANGDGDGKDGGLQRTTLAHHLDRLAVPPRA